MKQIKAIQTRYKSYHFRSRLEARYAVFFDALGINWEYEPDGFDIDGVKYLPDFLIRDNGIFPDLWIEVKPMKAMTKKESRNYYKIGKVISSISKNVGCLFLKGDPVDCCGFLFGSFNGKGKLGNVSGVDYVGLFAGRSKLTPKDVESAAIKARSARFEHGETPQ